jgi:hypothetical protein
MSFEFATDANDATVCLSPSNGAGNLIGHLLGSVRVGYVPSTEDMPSMISRAQAYYWTARWQTDTFRSREALAAGDFREFDNGDDLVRWLLEAE